MNYVQWLDMDKTCQNCKHWMTEIEPEPDGEADDARCCEIVSYTDYKSPDWNKPKQAFIATHKGDTDPVSGMLFTRPTFGCNQFEPKAT